jgi:hypothetical protein
MYLTAFPTLLSKNSLSLIFMNRIKSDGYVPCLFAECSFLSKTFPHSWTSLIYKNDLFSQTDHASQNVFLRVTSLSSCTDQGSLGLTLATLL